MSQLHHDRLLILDFGSQFTQLIARRVREQGVYCELFPWDVDPQRIADFAPKGVILSGGPESVTDGDGAPKIPDAVWALGVPLLGVCYGMQALAHALGGQVVAGDQQEFGYAKVRARGHSALLRGIEDERNAAGHGLLDVWMSHGDHVEVLPPGFHCIGSSDSVPIAAMADETRQIYAVQFHPEVTHTRQGEAILRRFAVEICGCVADWRPAAIAEELVEQMREKVGDQRVLLGLSGGVDSSVVAALLHKAIGDQLVCVFVDNGLLRLHEADQVRQTFVDHLGARVIFAEAQALFLDALADEADPEAKRKIIGAKFVEVFEAEAEKLDNITFLAQGTIYPDVIESAGASTGKAHVIKSHHNVGGLPAHMRLKLLEPLRDLFKDEVRKIGIELGLPPGMVYRHPFPGPGLGVRMLGALDRESLDLLRIADDIFISALRDWGWYDKVSQAFAVFLPVKSVGVTGDGRRYAPVIGLRAVETVDFMTARWAHLPYEFLDEVSRRIVNRLPQISRVVYDISGKPPATIEWE